MQTHLKKTKKQPGWLLRLVSRVWLTRLSLLSWAWLLFLICATLNWVSLFMHAQRTAASTVGIGRHESMLGECRKLPLLFHSTLIWCHRYPIATIDSALSHSNAVLLSNSDSDLFPHYTLSAYSKLQGCLAADIKFWRVGNIVIGTEYISHSDKTKHCNNTIVNNVGA